MEAAKRWQPDAYPVTAFSTGEGYAPLLGDDGRCCREWVFFFYSRVAEERFVVGVGPAGLTGQPSSLPPVKGDPNRELIINDAAIDSTAAVDVADRNGGNDFKARAEGNTLDRVSLATGPTSPDPRWFIDYRPSNLDVPGLQIVLSAKNGSVLAVVDTTWISF